MDSPWPIPHSWREALWLVVAIFIASRKGIKNGVAAFMRTLRTAPADADKTRAEAESIRTTTAVSSAALIREMSINLGQATLLGGQLKEKLASKESIIILQQDRIRELEARVDELELEQARRA